MLHANFVVVHFLKTSRPAIGGKMRCSAYKLWQKYNCDKRAFNIALSYGIDVSKGIISLFYVTMQVQNYAAFRC